MPVINVQGGLGDMLNLINPQTGETIQVPFESIFKDVPPTLDEDWDKNGVWSQKLTHLKDVPYPQPAQAGMALVYAPGKSNAKYMFDWAGIINFNIAEGRVPENVGYVDVPSIIAPDGQGDANAQARALVMRDNYLKYRIDQVVSEAGSGLVGFTYAEKYPVGSVGFKIQGWVDPRIAPFNAIGDGINSKEVDTLALNAALQYAADNRYGVTLPPGVWDWSDIHLPSNTVLYQEYGSIIMPSTHSPHGAILTNVNTTPTARTNIHLLNPQVSGILLPFTGTVNANDNGIGFASGMDGLYIYGGEITDFRANHQNGPGGKGIGFEQGVKNVHVFGTKIKRCTYATFTSAHLNFPDRYVGNINFYDLDIEQCGNALFAFGFSNIAGTVPTDDPDMCSVSWNNCKVRNTGHHPDRTVAGRKEKTGVIVIAGASFVRVKNMNIINDKDYISETSPAGATLFPTGYPTYESGRIGGGLSGPIGAVVWEFGANNHIEVTYSGDCDDLYKCSMARATGAVSFAGQIRPTACFGRRIDITHLNGTCKSLMSSGVIGGSYTVTSATSNTIVVTASANLNERDDFYIGSTVTFTSGAANGFTSDIIDYDAATRTMTLETPFTTLPDAGDIFNLGSTAAVADTDISGVLNFQYNEVSENLINSSFRLPTKVRGEFKANTGKKFEGSLASIFATGNLTTSVDTTGSGTWVPTVSNLVNVDGAVTIVSARYSRNGNAVTISGIFTVKALANGSIGFQITPPFPVTLTTSSQVAGTTSALDGQVFADTTNQKIRFSMIPSDLTTVRQYSFTALYTL